MPAELPCRLHLHQHAETCGTVGQHKTKYACIVEADESVRIRMEGSQSKNHEDHIAGRDMNYKFIPLPEAKAVVEKEWEKWGKYRHGT